MGSILARKPQKNLGRENKHDHLGKAWWPSSKKKSVPDQKELKRDISNDYAQ